MKDSVFIDKEAFKDAFTQKIENKYAVRFNDSTIRQRYTVLGELIREYVAIDWLKTKELQKKNNDKEVYYFSMEFLMGRLITNNINNLGLRSVIKEAFLDLNLDINEIESYEKDPGLGNGGLGRLAACFLDSIASLGYPGYGNGIRYRYGLFEQEISNGYQLERPDDWLSEGYVWEVRRDELAQSIPFGGYTYYNYEGKIMYEPGEIIQAVPYDVPIIGNKNGVVNHLRLWNAELSDYIAPGVSAFKYNESLRKLSEFLYPDDATDEGKIIRLKQQYFFTAAGVNEVVQRHYIKYNTLDNFHEKICFHINDTHPTLIIPEFMRILLDEYNYEWVDAWKIVTKTCAYTNHTILAEALEKWPVRLIQPLLPRVYQIIEEINRRFCLELMENYTTDQFTINRLAIIGDGTVRMANLAIVGSFSVNGVARLHTDILKNIEMKDFNNLFPDRYNNKTNGITHRRWCEHINPELNKIIEGYTENWVKNPMELEKLVPKAKTKKCQKAIAKMKLNRKKALAEKIYKEQGIQLDVNSIFDVQVKRLHEYKRQLMNALHILTIYNRLKSDNEYKMNYYPHSFIFGAKAASGYHFAKKIIKLINSIADIVNNDPDTNDLLKVVFVENYNVSYAELIMPACDVSEQISTASKEASGTGNMKFMMNGAITIGTLDGANVEIAELVGDNNIVIFGMNAEEVNDLYRNRCYNPTEYYHNNPLLKQAIDQLTNGFFDEDATNSFKEISEKLLTSDSYFILKDFEAYKEAHEKINSLYKNRENWLKMSIINIAKSGYFSSDRTIKQYAEEIWNIVPMVTE